MRILIILVVLLTLFLCSHVIGAELLVPSQYPTIQDAIDEASNSDTVTVSNGTYIGTGNNDIYFKGKEITVRSENGPYNCIIDCNNTGNGFYFQNAEGPSSVLEGFTIINGGVGIYCEWSDPTIRNCIIMQQLGGGIYCERSGPTIIDCIIMQNTAVSGGGVANYNGSDPTIINCIISDNTAYERGGGIYDSGSSSRITNCIITGNTSLYEGGGIYISSDDTKISNCIIRGNMTIAPKGGWGGGIYFYECSPEVRKCIIQGNMSPVGGGMYLDRCDPWLSNCIVTVNKATYDGGGIYMYISDPTISNCTFCLNTAAREGGGVYCRGSKNSPVLTDNILWLNEDDSGITELAQITGGAPSINYSCIQGLTGALGGDGNIDADPLFTGQGLSTPNEGLVSYWAFDEGEDLTAYDAIGDNNGVIDGAGWVRGQLDDGLAFDGVDDYVEVSDNNSLDFKKDFSLSLWFKVDPIHQSSYSHLINKRESSANKRGY